MNIANNTVRITRLLDRIAANATEKIAGRKHIAVTGPSGSGKTSIIRGDPQSIIKVMPFEYGFSVSATTRPQRKNEIQNVDYDFVSEKVFHSMELLEDNAYLGNSRLYGTKLSEIVRICLHERKRVCLDLDINGGLAVKRIFKKDLLWVFLDTPIDTLRHRLSRRKVETGESDEQIEGRIIAATKEKLRVESAEVKPDVILRYNDDITPAMAANEIILKAAYPTAVQ